MHSGIPMEIYSERAVRHFMSPSNIRPLPVISGIGCATHDTLGDIIELSLHIDRLGVIRGVRCRTYGCPAAVATGSALSELLEGRTLAETQRLQPQDVLSATGGLPSRQSCYAHLPLLALRAAVENYRERQRETGDVRARRFIHRRIRSWAPGLPDCTSSAA